MEPGGSTGVNYYYAGSQRVAMRVGTTLSYLFGDHLGSTSITADASGNVSGELRYLPFGATRYENGQMPTSFRYTGQREAAEIGLYFYGARWYDSYLGRWTQPDTEIPDPYYALDWDRYCYVRNNPVGYNDPSGHGPLCPQCTIAKWAISVYAAYKGAAAIGLSPDLVGVIRAEAIMDRDTGSIEVAAGLAVQGEFSGAVGDHIAALLAHGDPFSSESGFGPAQATDEWINAYGLSGSPYDSDVAVGVMQARIENAQNACPGCSAQDLVIVAALAQNGGFESDKALESLTGAISSGKDLGDFIAGNWPPGGLRAQAAGLDSYWFLMVKKYVQDMRVLHLLGWELPEGVTMDDLDYLEEWADNYGEESND